jgi:hypothetical protein
VNLIILDESLRKNLLSYQSKNGAKAAHGDGTFPADESGAPSKKLLTRELSAAIKTEMTTEMKTG